MRPADRLALPSLITLAGYVLGAIGLVIGVEHGWPFLFASILFDALDGYVAKKLDTVTEFGAAFDLHVDMALGFACLWRTLPPAQAAVWTILVVAWQAVCCVEEARFSGRIPIFLCCILVYAGC